jgi:hypothetical protein
MQDNPEHYPAAIDAIHAAHEKGGKADLAHTQEEKRRLWRKLNALKPERPMVMIDQVCWNEMNLGDELALRCTDPECKGYEWGLRSTLFQWQHFPVDMVVEPFVRVAKAINNTGFGVGVREQTAVTDPSGETRYSLGSVLNHVLLHQTVIGLEAKKQLKLAGETKPDVIILGSGSEIQFCLGAAEILQKEGVKVRVVNMPSFELFDRQPESYSHEVLPPEVTARLAVEAAHPMSWYKYVGSQGGFQCMQSYGGSAPLEQLYKHFGFTAENVAAKARKLAGK